MVMGRPYLVCEQIGKGPKCTRRDHEISEGEQNDCFFAGKIGVVTDINRCMAEFYGSFASGCRTVPVCNGMEAEINCIGNLDWTEYFGTCFCTGLSGYVCSVCQPVFDQDDNSGATTTEKTFNEISVTTSDWGGDIPIVVGKAFLGGNIIWIGNKRLTTVTTKVLDGDVWRVTTNEIGYLDMAVAFCEGEIEAARRIWIDRVLIVNNGGALLTDEETIPFAKAYYDVGFNTTLYSGTETQDPAPEIVSDKGMAYTPAHRGLCYMIFRNFPIFYRTGEIPLIRIEAIEEVNSAATAHQAITLSSNSLITVEPESGRLYTTNGTTIKVINTDDMTEEETITIAGVNPATLTFSAQGKKLFRGTGGALVANFGLDHIVTLTSATTIPSGSQLAALYVYDVANTDGFEVVIAGQADDIYLFKLTDTAITHLHTHNAVTTGTIQKLFACTVASDNAGLLYAKRTYHAVCQEGDTIAIVNGTLTNYAQSQDFDATRITTKNTLSLTANDVTITDAIYNSFDHSIIIFAEVDGLNRIIKWSISDAAIEWNVEVAELPADSVYFRSGFNNTFKYVVNQTLYLIDLSDGDVGVDTLTSTAPAQTGPQFYDDIRQVLYYVGGNDFTKYTSGYMNGVDSSGGRVFDRLFAEAGLASHERDVSGAGGPVVAGAVITKDRSVEEFMNYFGAIVVESDGKLKAKHKGTATNHIVDEEDTNELVTVRPQLNTNGIGQVSVNFLDDSRDGEPGEQTVSSIIIDEEADISIDKGYSSTVYATPTQARVVAEQLMMRDASRSNTTTQRAPPSMLAMEPGDYINGERINKLQLDETLKAQVNSLEDDQFIYTDSPAITGITYEYTDIFQSSSAGLVRNTPVILNVPIINTANDFVLTEKVYVGQLRSNTSEAFVGEAVYLRSDVGNYVLQGTPTKELLQGTVVTPPNNTHAVFSTDYESEIVIEFDNDVPATYFTNHSEISTLYDTYTSNVLYVGDEIIQFREFEIDVDNRTVTFRDLFRGRWGTDRYVGNHVVGERAFAYDPDALISVTVPTSARLGGAVTVALATAADSPNRRLASTYFIPQLTKPWAPTNFKRRDVPDISSDYASGIYFCWEPRTPFAPSFQDDTSDGVAAAPDLHYEVYVLNDVYNPTTFATKRAENNYPTNNPTGVGTNTYIERVFNGDLILGGDRFTHYYSLRMVDDEVEFNQTLSIALVITSPDDNGEEIFAANFEGLTAGTETDFSILLWINMNDIPTPYTYNQVSEVWVYPTNVKHAVGGRDYYG